MTRVLIIGSSANGSLERFYEQGLRRLGVAAKIFDPERPLGGLRRQRLLNRLTWSKQHFVVDFELRRFFSSVQNYDLVLVFKGYFITPEALHACKRRAGRAVWANINPDSPFDPGRATSNAFIRASIPLYDAYFIWSRRLMAELTAAGAKQVIYLPFGYDPDSHFPAEELDPALARTVTFVGSFDKQRAQVLEHLADQDIQIFGNAWNDLPARSRLRNKVRSAAIAGQALRRAVTSSLASINILRPQNAGSHNMRTFEVPAMGGLMLASLSEEQDQFFPHRQASLMFRDPDGLRSLVRELTAGSVDTQALKARGLELSREHSYTSRASFVLASLGLSSGLAGAAE